MIDFLKILKTLTDYEVDFVLVGALSAAVQGAQVSTFDVDIVHDRGEANLRRLESALTFMNARYRGHDDLVPTIEHLRTPGHRVLMTDYGPLDVLGTIEDELDYAALSTNACIVSMNDFDVQALRLSDYLKIRRAHPRPRDHARFPILESALGEEE